MFLVAYSSGGMLEGDMGVKMSPISAPTVDFERQQVEAELERILESAGFRNSKRSQEFLRYIVITALDGRFEDLKERIIGTHVFQRCPDYDTGEHSIVRVKANELRKRLAQFYAETTQTSSVQIHLPRGSYTPEFRWTEIPEPPQPLESVPSQPHAVVSSRTRFLLSRVALAVLVLIVLMLAGSHLRENKSESAVEERFWRPLLQDLDQPLICVADPEVFRFKEGYDAFPSNRSLPNYVPASELVRDSGHYVGWGDALALTRLSTFLALHRKEAQIRIGNDVSFAELSRFPVILIGARSNPWTVLLANNFRFVFERSEKESFIRDKTDPNKKWSFELGTPKVDYVVITRVFESRTGRMIVLAAGLSHIGTQVAGETLTNAAYLSKALRGAPTDWPKRNMQLLLRVEIFGNGAGPPTLVASSFW
jgi:hypothetical protein